MVARFLMSLIYTEYTWSMNVIVCLELATYKLETFKLNSTKMEFLSDESFSLSYWDYFSYLLLRPVAAILFTASLLFFGQLSLFLSMYINW